MYASRAFPLRRGLGSLPGPLKERREVVQRFQLLPFSEPFSRCVRCNALLEPVEKANLDCVLPEKVAQLHTDFKRCPSCRRVYWKGSHYERMQELIHNLYNEHPDS